MSLIHCQISELNPILIFGDLKNVKPKAQENNLNKNKIVNTIY